MVQTVPMVLPAAFVHTYALDLAAPYTDGWSFEHVDVGFGAAGEMYVLSWVRCHRPDGEDAEDPAAQTLSHWIITRYAPGDGTADVTAPTATAVFATPRTYSKYGDAWAFRLAVLPDGTVALSGRHDSTYLLDADLTRVVGAHTTNPFRSAFDPYTVGRPFATRIRVTPGGRLLCSVAEYGAGGYGSYGANLIALADEPLTPEHRPHLEAIASVDARPQHQKPELDVRPYISHQGHPVGLEHRPSPSLVDLVHARWPLRFPNRGMWLGDPAALADDRFVVPVFGRLFRGGNRGTDFAYALLDDKGELTGRLEGFEPYRDSPFTGGCYRIAADPARGRVHHLNRYGLFGWTADGTLRARVRTDDKPYSLLKNFTLLGCAPDGALILVQEKQHLLLRVPLPDDAWPDHLDTALADALAAFGKKRTALKKQWHQTAWHWTHEPPEGTLHFL